MFAISSLYTAREEAKHQIDGVKKKDKVRNSKGFSGVQVEILPNTIHDGCDPRLVSVAHCSSVLLMTKECGARCALIIHHQEVQKGGDLTNVFIVDFSSIRFEHEQKSIDAKVACSNEKI